MNKRYINNTLDTERRTLHLSDDEKRFAIIDTLTVSGGQTITPVVTIRYQYDNHLGSACLELDENASIISYEEYHPFGTTSYRSGRSQTEVSLKRYKYCGKERDEETGLYYYGMRYYAAWICRFVSVDPLQFKYPELTPFQYCANNPIRYIDPDGRDWYEGENGAITWTDYTSQQEMDDNNISGTYLGQAVVSFVGSRNEQLGTKNGNGGYIDGDGAVTASVTVYGPKGADDIHNFTGYTMSSDGQNAIDEGTYSGNYDAVGKSGALKSNWAVNNRGEVRMMDGKINPNAPSQVDANGDGYKLGIFIHSTNKSGYAGGNVSKGCLLISANDWKDFNNVMSGVTDFSVKVSRNINQRVPLQGVTGAVRGINVIQSILKKD